MFERLFYFAIILADDLFNGMSRCRDVGVNGFTRYSVNNFIGKWHIAFMPIKSFKFVTS